MLEELERRRVVVAVPVPSDESGEEMLEVFELPGVPVDSVRLSWVPVVDSNLLVMVLALELTIGSDEVDVTIDALLVSELE